MTTDVFEKIWDQASSRHPAGLVKTKHFYNFFTFMFYWQPTLLEFIS